MMSNIYQKDQNEVEDDDKEERKHFQRVINAFRCYRSHSFRRLAISEQYYLALPEHHKAMLPNFMKSRKALRKCVDANYEVLKEIINNTNQMFVNKDHGPVDEETDLPHASEFDMDRVTTTLKQIMRDWSSEGKAERDACYGPVLDEIAARFPRDKCETDKISVLVPGAGIGRLAFEVAQLGYQTQGNEFSFFMLFTSNFILNRCRETDIFTLYPWIHQYCNNKKTEDQRYPVHFPDSNPAELLNAEFSMTAGDFLEVYTERDMWDCVATVYFIDTAHNIIAYIEAIYKILKPGGIWVNFGPLLYHFAEIANESSIELSYEEVRKIIKICNFTLLKEQTDMKSTYTQNPRSMLQYEYNCVFFVAQKPLMNSDINSLESNQ